MNAPPPKLNLLAIRSQDSDRAAAFYRALGLVITRHAHGGPEHYQRNDERTVRLAVDSVDDLTPVLVIAGAEVLEPPHESEWGRRAVVRDLDGHHVEIVSDGADRRI